MAQNEVEARRHYESAVALHRQGRLAAAERHYSAVRRLYPDHPGVLHGLGLIWLSGGRAADAAEVLERAATLAREDAAIRSDLGRAWLLRGRYEDAADCFRFARGRRPDDVGTLIGLGEALSVLGETAEAKAMFEAAIAREPGRAAAHYGLGNIEAQHGRRAEARRAFEQAIALAPDAAAYHRALAEQERFRDGDPRLAAMEQLAAREETPGDGNNAELHFALAKAHDDLGYHDAAFANLAKANAIQRRRIDYDEVSVAQTFDALRRVFTPELFERHRGEGFDSDVPVFVVGIPRSGTSLIEQILAAHPNVNGAGELQYIGQQIAEGLVGAPYPESIASLSHESLKAFGERYAARVSNLAPDAARIVDKLPANFRHLGLIHLVLPAAKIVHVRREAMDTCFSCFSKLFPPGLDFAYEQGELGRYYRMYETMMAHWRAVLPPGAMIEVSYEALLDEFETQARRLLEFIGLEWDERCLRFHESDRPVRTLSQAQVREPLFHSSVGRWKPYERFLQPLRDALNVPTRAPG